VSPVEIASLLTASCAAGVINAVAGGGTLVTFPVLVLFGMNPVIANATSTLSLAVGNAGSVYGFRDRLQEVKPWLATFIPVSLLGGWLGSVLLTHASEEMFSKLAPYLVLFSTLLFMLQGVLTRKNTVPVQDVHPPKTRKAHLITALIFQFFVSIYGGYFGAGIGILMLASLGFMGFSDIHRMNTLKTVLGSLINLIAAIWFTLSGLINWPHMVLMTLGAILGYYLGSTYSQRLSQKMVRQVIMLIGLIITAVMFWKFR
jgi:hypothetical protein